MVRIAFYTLGCKVNQYESEALSSRFSQEGFTVVPPSEDAEVYVVNSCTVTSGGDKKTRQILRRFKREHPGAVIALTGCFPQAFPDAAEKLPEADVITGSYNRAALVDSVKSALSTGDRVINITPHKQGESFERMRAPRFSEHTRAFVKIEDGCDRYCSYCIIPTARGPIRSKPLEDLQEELAALADNGYKEVVLVGINLSSYGKGTDLRLADAVELACSVPGIERVRLGSLEPELLTDEDMDRFAAQDKFCPQFHLSLQSGSASTLKRMNRHYTPEEYLDIVSRLRARFANASMTTDIMVGFPGETLEEFEESVSFAEQVGFAKVHVFAYSRRSGTRADRMDGQIPQREKERRSAEMIRRTDQTRLAFLYSQVGRTEEVLLETQVSPGEYEGYTKNYTPCLVQTPQTAGESDSVDLCGQIKYVTITGVSDGRCTAVLADAKS